MDTFNQKEYIRMFQEGTNIIKAILCDMPNECDNAIKEVIYVDESINDLMKNLANSVYDFAVFCYESNTNEDFDGALNCALICCNALIDEDDDAKIFRDMVKEMASKIYTYCKGVSTFDVKTIAGKVRIIEGFLFPGINYERIVYYGSKQTKALVNLENSDYEPTIIGTISSTLYSNASQEDDDSKSFLGSLRGGSFDCLISSITDFIITSRKNNPGADTASAVKNAISLCKPFPSYEKCSNAFLEMVTKISMDNETALGDDELKKEKVLEVLMK